MAMDDRRRYEFVTASIGTPAHQNGGPEVQMAVIFADDQFMLGVRLQRKETDPFHAGGVRLGGDLRGSLESPNC